MLVQQDLRIRVLQSSLEDPEIIFAFVVSAASGADSAKSIDLPSHHSFFRPTNIAGNREKISSRMLNLSIKIHNLFLSNGSVGVSKNLAEEHRSLSFLENSKTESFGECLEPLVRTLFCASEGKFNQNSIWRLCSPSRFRIKSAG